MSTILQEVVSIKGHDSGLVRLSDVSKDHVHHACRGAQRQREAGEEKRSVRTAAVLRH